MEKGIELKIAEEVKKAGGRVFYVGGYVRDRLLNINNKDVDIEVHGITAEKLYEILKSVGQPLKYGDSFGVYSLKGYDIDIAMPRSEKATGKGHRDFEVTVDPFIGYDKAARRRDFTINALMQDVISDEIIDSFNGIEDLNNKVLRCVDPVTFIEDPLRALRAAQFASRFEFAVEQNTIDLCRTINLEYLSKERVFEEMKKALLKGKKPSVFFETLKEMNQLDFWFKEVKDLIGVKQDEIHHPEGDVYTHTMEVIDRAVEYRDNVSDPLYFVLFCLCHDFGKVITTEVIDGRIHAYEHETKGLPLINNFLNRLSNEKELIHYVSNMVPLHMKPLSLIAQNSSDKAYYRMFDKAINKEDLIWFAFTDKAGSEEYKTVLFEKLDAYNRLMEKPFVTGKDLIEAGIEPDEHFSEYLEYAHNLRLADVKKEAALSQTLSYIKQKKNGN